MEKTALFTVGTLVRHRLFGYRGVIFDVDAEFLGSEEWYAVMARSRPPRDAPWYHVLVHGQEHTTYVAERNLREDEAPQAVEHPLLESLFDGFENGRYRRRVASN